ncbi:hypothetical protein C1646_776293 [Rhizophagus diaphanus]|nr:hypothetical protein C1646_776293 [Rhizophagus diaphanus] [Rhizophagus sp. MUCL 43196]
MELIRSKKLGPEFVEKYHSEAIYTSRSLNTLISECSSKSSLVKLSSTISFDNKQLDYNNAYISLEQEFDIDILSLPLQNLNLTI